MNNAYGIAVVCVPSDRLITDESGEQFYECMTQEELERIAKEKDKDTLKTYLFNALSMLDSTISTIATSIEKGLPIQVKIVFTIKDSIKGSVLNMDNEDLSVSEKIVLGGVTIGIGIISILTLPENIIGIIASLIISYITTWFLSNFYIKLRNTTLHLWQEAKDLANSTWQNIMSLIESDERNLEERKRDITNKVADEILNLQETPNENFIKNISQENYNDLIHLLCQEKTNAKDIHQYLEDSKCIMCNIPQQSYTPLSPQGISFPYSSIIYLTTIKALKDTLKEYLPKAKKIVLYTPNPFVSLYTSSPFYVFNSNLSFFNPHLQYLLTSKDTQQWLYDTLFSLARDNREIIVYEWGGSIEELDFKESQTNKKDLDSKDTNQSTNIQKQTKTYYLSPQGQKLKEKQPYCIRVIAKESKVFTILRDFITSFNTTKEQEVFRALEILLKDKESLEHLRQCVIKSLKEPIIESIYSLKETKDLNKEELKENVEEV
ncbi:hypothetical protein CNT07_06665, partial [Campylobacter coli]|nr:hypothetical protein [Campylobacter coli]